ncbi:hypothetical protein [Anaerosolibacter sp.]|uniref:hypothetical protein n=1 Tax=Anaerosolibacter sp. TaxID=1872527 RepID=UPI0039EE2ACA
MKSMKLSQYFQIIRPEYIYLKLTPTNSIRNYNSDKIAKAIQHLYKNLNQRIQRHEKQFFFEVPSKVSYYIYIEKTKVEFYFIIPKLYLSLVKEKISDTWKGITITEVESIPNFSSEATMYTLTYKNEDPLSLSVDKRTNTLLGSTLNVIDVMEEGDRVGVFYNFIPTSQFSWRATYDRTMKKIDNKEPVDREKLNFGYAFKMSILGFIWLANMLTEIVNDLAGSTQTKKQEQSFLELAISQVNKRSLSTATNAKKEKTVLDTQILVMSESTDKKRINNNAVSVCQSFKSIAEDNELVYKKYKNKNGVNLMNLKIEKVETNKISIDECQNFISLPGRELLEEHNCIEKIDTFESEVPEELQDGVMCIGKNTYRGNTQRAFLTTDKEFKNLTLTIIGPTRAGKTNLIANLSKNGLDNDETMIIFDYCGNCELSLEISAVMDPQKVLTIDCSDFDKMQGLGYNEVTASSDDPLEVYRCAKTKTSQLMTLVNSIAGDELRDRMERYLESAAVIVFIQNGSIKDVFAVLQNHKIRYEYVKNIPEDQKEQLEEYIMSLEEIDETSKVKEEIEVEGKPVKVERIVVSGTRTTYVQGILNRVNKLKQNTYMELMLKKDCSDNINLIDEMQKAQLICIKMPEIMFSTEMEKDIYATYWLTKIWGALQKRKWDIPDAKDRIKVNVVIDELYQVPNCQEFLRSKLSQIAKFSCKPIISCHYLGQIGIIRDELKAANSSYMLVAGCDKDNFNELKNELYPYQVEDLLNLKRFQSLNLIKYEKGFARFITNLPTDIILK